MSSQFYGSVDIDVLKGRIQCLEVIHRCTFGAKHIVLISLQCMHRVKILNYRQEYLGEKNYVRSATPDNQCIRKWKCTHYESDREMVSYVERT